jgi:hypothetical protein
MEQSKQIIQYGTSIFQSASPPLIRVVGEASWGSTGMRQTGSYTAVWGTLVSESWSSGTKEIVSIETVYGTITTASVIQVSLQNITSSSDSIIVPDNNILAVWTGSTANITSDNLVTHSLFTPYIISTGSVIATVLEYIDRGGTLPQLGFKGFDTYPVADNNVGASIKLSTASTWTATADYLTCIRFRCSDNSFVYYQNGYLGLLSSSTGTATYQSNTTGTGIDGGDERGMLWVPKKTYDITEFRVNVRFPSSTSEADIVLYRDTTILTSQSIDNLLSSTRFAYGQVLNIPIRVYPNDNIRLTVKPRVLDARWDRLSFVSSDDMVTFFGGPTAESNLSVTNRVDGGAWNTPIGAEYSFTPIQFYGREVVGAELISGSNVVSGSIILNGSPIEGATIRVIRSSDNTSTSGSSDVNGYYQFNLASGSYHVIVEYENGGQKYNALSSWNVSSV